MIPSREQVSWAVTWTLVFAANLPILLVLGWGVTDRGGRVGMFAALAVYVGLGCWVVQNAKLRPVLLIGGSAVAVSQGCPVLQVMSGVVSLAFWGWVGEPDRALADGSLSELGGFVVTLATGGLLLGAAAVAGGLFCAIFAGPERVAGSDR